MSDIQVSAKDMGLKVRSYSGRAMFGKECLGIIADMNQMIQLFYELGRLDCVKPSGPMKSDRMGYDTIYYFPNERFVEGGDDEEEGFNIDGDDDDAFYV